jgi:hypothetical protein
MIKGIYDRNLLDINYAKSLLTKIKAEGYESLEEDEKKSWERGLKGFLNYTDLNRIEANILELSQIFNLNLRCKSWEMIDIPVTLELQRICFNVRKIREKNYIYKETPETPSLPLNHYQKINDIEKILYDVYVCYSENSREVDYVEEIYTDEQIGVL